MNIETIIEWGPTPEDAVHKAQDRFCAWWRETISYEATQISASFAPVLDPGTGPAYCYCISIFWHKRTR